MILRLLRWLARHEIIKAYQAGFAQGQLINESHSALRYETGRLDGARQAFDAIEIAALDYYSSTNPGEHVHPHDVAKARKGFVH